MDSRVIDSVVRHPLAICDQLHHTEKKTKIKTFVGGMRRIKGYILFFRMMGASVVK